MVLYKRNREIYWHLWVLYKRNEVGNKGDLQF